jgi:hypothetical protein
MKEVEKSEPSATRRTNLLNIDALNLDGCSNPPELNLIVNHETYMREGGKASEIFSILVIFFEIGTGTKKRERSDQAFHSSISMSISVQGGIHRSQYQHNNDGQ